MVREVAAIHCHGESCDTCSKLRGLVGRACLVPLSNYPAFVHLDVIAKDPFSYGVVGFDASGGTRSAVALTRAWCLCS